ncbi:MAG: hypothetical protein PHC64_04380 [Candidatus Gastranaerophilales bacterium]|nr:hypothetical protein [Candidatus Gastranaerophilales bacterium]
MKKKYTNENIGKIEILKSDLTPEEESMFDDKIEQAEKELISRRNNATVNFRWSEFEIARAKKIAKKLGMPYQTYIKLTLEKAITQDELK